MKSIKKKIALATIIATAMVTGCSSTEGDGQEKVIHYAFDKASITPEGKKILDKEVEYLKGKPNVQVHIEGHSDSRGTPEYNMALGDQRAKSVKKYLTDKSLKNKIETKSYGEEKPKVQGASSEADHKQNRRAVLIYK